MIVIGSGRGLAAEVLPSGPEAHPWNRAGLMKPPQDEGPGSVPLGRRSTSALITPRRDPCP